MEPKTTPQKHFCLLCQESPTVLLYADGDSFLVCVCFSQSDSLSKNTFSTNCGRELCSRPLVIKFYTVAPLPRLLICDRFITVLNTAGINYLPCRFIILLVFAARHCCAVCCCKSYLQIVSSRVSGAVDDFSCKVQSFDKL